MVLNLVYSFQDPGRSRQFQYLHPKLIKLFGLCCHILNEQGYDVVVTSMVRPVNSIPGESNVHATGRAIDFIPVVRTGKVALNLKLMPVVARCIDEMFKRGDGKSLILWHQVDGGRLHFHLQVPADSLFEDLSGVVPKDDA